VDILSGYACLGAVLLKRIAIDAGSSHRRNGSDMA